MNTPTPWTVGFACRIVTGRGNSVALTSGEASSFSAETNQANADFIVRACNSHAALVEALHGMLEVGEMRNFNRAKVTQAVEQARAALKQAEVSA